MKDSKFVWLGTESVARNGKTLSPGQTYAASDFPAEVVAEWIKTGAAKAAVAGKTERKDND